MACVLDKKVVVFDRAESAIKAITDISPPLMNSKYIPCFTTGKWSHHHQGQLFLTLNDCSIKAYDLRDCRITAWQVNDAHSQFVRDIDCNPNKQFHYVTGGDDAFIKIWDSRKPNKPIFERNDHCHWIWSVRFNTFHDQLILSSSSDWKVNLTCAGSASSENEFSPLEVTENNVAEKKNLISNNRFLEDGLLQTFDQHEDSVYAAEWSNIDPWIFASISHDGRVLISKVPKQFKYEIIF